MITVVICTYNRRRYLKKAIDSIINQTFDPELYELIIVDNNSSDGTKEFVLNDYSHSRVKVKYVNEPSQGVSHCRNTGLRHARFDYVAYIDDDGIAYPDWLESMSEVIKNQNEKFAGITGAIFPIWEIPRPRWFLRNFEMAYGIFNPDKRFVSRRGGPVTVFGANMVWKKNLLIKFGGFNTNLGRMKNNLIVSEETFIGQKIVNKDYEFIYDPKMKIKHHILKPKLNITRFINISFWRGYSRIVMENIKNKKGIKIKFRQSFTEIRIAFFNIGLVPTAIILKPKYHFLINIFEAANSLGRLYGLLKIK